MARTICTKGSPLRKSGIPRTVIFHLRTSPFARYSDLLSAVFVNPCVTGPLLTFRPSHAEHPSCASCIVCIERDNRIFLSAGTVLLVSIIGDLDIKSWDYAGAPSVEPALHQAKQVENVRVYTFGYALFLSCLTKARHSFATHGRQERG